MYVNGVYVSGVEYKFERGEGYKGIDVLISSAPSHAIVGSIVGDYTQKGVSGYCFWGTAWPPAVHVWGTEDRVGVYAPLCVSNKGKELLFFKGRHIEGGLNLLHGLGTYLTPSNIGFILRDSSNVQWEPGAQVIIILEEDLYNNPAIACHMHSTLGWLKV